MLKKTVNGKTTTFTFDGANQLVSSTVDGVTTRYTYDAAGRLVKEGSKTYTYGYLDKVMSVSDGKQKLTYDYHADGQIASANYGNGKTEEFLWDGLALVRRGGEQFINELHIGGGNPVVSSKGTSYFNDMLGTTVGSKSNGKYSAAVLTAFGERLDNVDNTSPAIRSLGEGWFTGKPYVEGLGHVFLMRNYRAGLAKWQTADPLGYPDGWNQLAYCGNGVSEEVDVGGCVPLNGCVIPENRLPMIKGREYDGLLYKLAVFWSCNHDFYNPVITSNISVAAGVESRIENYYYKGDNHAILEFSYIVVEDYAKLLKNSSVPWEKVFELYVEVEIYVHIAYMTEEGEKVDQVFKKELSFQNIHSIERPVFE